MARPQPHSRAEAEPDPPRVGYVHGGAEPALALAVEDMEVAQQARRRSPATIDGLN